MPFELDLQQLKGHLDIHRTYILQQLFFVSAERLSNFNIAVGDSFDPLNKDSFDPSTFTQCAHISGQLGAGETRTIQCNQPVRGRYVSVNLNQRNPLTICEFEVHGTPAGNHSLFISWNKYRL